jgi:NAD(P)-dependent dehydrogenase (short-subunit alcohol dehydrogenase family)
MGKLDGRVAVITGGSGGIGRDAAKLFVDEGANVLLVDIEERALRSAVGAIGENHASSVCADVTSADDTQQFVKTALERYGRIDVFLANAASRATSSRSPTIQSMFLIVSWQSTSAAYGLE